MLQKNQIIEVEIVALSHEGDGIARHDGIVVFIPMTAIGDILSAKVVKVLKNRAYAIVEKLCTPSSHRIENDCPVFQQCGGCSLRHINYTHEVEVKHQWVTDNLERIGKVKIHMDPPIAAPSDCRYRNKAQYPVRRIDGKLQLGFFSKRSHRVIPVNDCLLQPAFFAEIGKTLCLFMQQAGIEAYDETSHTGIVRHLYIRWAEATGQVMVCIVINAAMMPQSGKLIELLREVCPNLQTLVLNHNKDKTNVILGKKNTLLYGDGVIFDEQSGIRARLSPHSFYQVNRSAAAILYEVALEFANPNSTDTLLDLYCGAGIIGLSMAHHVGQVIGIEVEPKAVQDAEENAIQNSISNARFLLGDASVAAQKLAQEGICPDIVLLDPPRKGADSALIAQIAAMAPRKIVYISCNSATLARDCALFADQGYSVIRARAVDLFPRTAHIETCVLLSREK